MYDIRIGDATELILELPEETIQTIYFDPPFNSQRNYFLQTGIGFTDVWDDDEYASFLTTMIEEFLRVLKPDGNLFFHISSKDSLLPMLLCSRFFPYTQNIFWKRSRSKNNVTKKLGSCVDIIIKCSKVAEPKFNAVYQELDAYYSENSYKNKDNRGFYALGHIIYTKSQATSNVDRLYSKEINGIIYTPASGWRLSETDLDNLIDDGRIHTPKSKNGKPYKKIYKHESKGKPATDLWDDVHSLSQGSEKRVYPTQKPEKLITRIIEMSTDVGDYVLDPTCGSGTTGICCTKLKRHAIMFDINEQAIQITKERLKQWVT